MSRTLVVVHNNIDGASAIGAVAEWAVRAGLERGWDVTTVCRDLEPSLRAEVNHRPLYVPPRMHLLQWSVARPTVKRAIGRRRPDAMLVYQPQLAAIADVWHVEYLSRAARNAGAPRRPGVKGWSENLQAAGVALLEDRYLHRIPTTTRVLFCSEGLREQYTSLFGTPLNSSVLYNPALLTVGRHPDRDRRRELTSDHAGPVIGFLGGGDPRKGGDEIVAGVAADPSLFLVHGGPSPLDDATIADRSHNLGHLRDVTQLLDVVDVLVVPSRFEPFGLVVAEAAARGVATVLRPAVGAAPLALACGAGVTWADGAPLGEAVAAAMALPDVVAAGRALVRRLDPATLADQLFAELDAAADRNRSMR